MKSKIKVILEGQARLHGFKKFRSYWIRPRDGSVDCLYFDRGTWGGESYSVEVALHFQILNELRLPNRAYQLHVRTCIQCLTEVGRLKILDSLDAERDVEDNERSTILAAAFSEVIEPFFDRLSSLDHLRANWEEERRGFALMASPEFLEVLASPPG